MAPTTPGVAPVAAPLSGLLNVATPFLFFTGKGGVGKTSVASAVSVALADAGRRVLIVSTDPASNLDEVLGVAAGNSRTPTPVPGIPGLAALNIDPEAAAAAYRERVVGPYRGVLPPRAVGQMEEELSGSCTVEIAAFNEFVALLTEPQEARDHDVVVFDTAPTGHTLRLLALPGAWAGFLATNRSGVTCIGPVSALGQAKDRYSEALAALRSRDRTTVVLVARPEPSALDEAARTSSELGALGLTHQRLVVNGVFNTEDGGDELAAAWRARSDEALATMPLALRRLEGVESVPLLAASPVGPAGLRQMLGRPTAPTASGLPSPARVDLADVGLRRIVDGIERHHGVVMTMGKGGVGKTSVAAAVAFELAHRGHTVTLTTTDPASHVSGVLRGSLTGLTVTRIDPVEETRAYTDAVMLEAGRSLDARGRDLLAEDLRSPCTEEVAVFHAFARTLYATGDEFVVIDTAPTGHTLLLLDSSRSFARQMASQSGDLPQAASALLDTLADPERTRILLVTLAEATPVHEAAQLMRDLARAGITPFSWVVNSSLAASGTKDPVLAARARAEVPYLGEVRRASGGRVGVVPWIAGPTRGFGFLAQMVGGHGPRR